VPEYALLVTFFTSIAGWMGGVLLPPAPGYLNQVSTWSTRTVLSCTGVVAVFCNPDSGFVAVMRPGSS